jgi:hypothetical protein
MRLTEIHFDTRQPYPDGMSSKIPNPTTNSEPAPFQWDFDRVLPADDPGFLTFSVGVFQWLPRASGRGLKKSTSIRVKGYAAEHKLVYHKAAELCRRLNHERVRSDNPPTWLQKQYSVPKPVHLVIERTSDDLTGAQVRGTRSQVMKRLLLPVGFVHAKGGTYVRKAGDQIHFIDFQAAQAGHEYTINLGFHYAFMVGFFHGTPLAPASFHNLDCGLRARIGQFTPGGLDTWYRYGSDRDQLRTLLEQNTEACLQIFAQHEEKWRHPKVWLQKLSDNGKVRPAFVKPWNLNYPQLFTASIAKEA